MIDTRKCISRRAISLRRASTSLISLFFLFSSVETLARPQQPGFVAAKSSRPPFCSDQSRCWSFRAASLSSGHEHADDGSRIPDSLVKSLDLAPVIRALSKHAGTRRGREAILGLTGQEGDAERLPLFAADTDDYMTSRRRRVARETQTKATSESKLAQNKKTLAPIATCAEDARKEYKIVQQATLVLEGSNGLMAVPPLYGATSSPMDTDTIPDTDHDEWLNLPMEEWTLEHVLQADQVVQTLLSLHEWGVESEALVPTLSEVTQTISEPELRSLHQEIQGSVEIVTKRSFVESQAMAYRFQLSEDRYPVLRILRQKEQILQDSIERNLKAVLRKLKGSPEALEHDGRMLVCVPKIQASPDLGIIRGTTDNGRRCFVEPHDNIPAGQELVAIRNELSSIERDIESGLMDGIRDVSTSIDRGIHAMARLDVVFAKAAFGRVLSGDIPAVRHDGRISVEDFVHPILLLQKGRSIEDPVPIDLLLSHDRGSRALIISGANGGGKTVALKSFGVACMLAKLGIPIPRSSIPSTEKGTARVDFFDNVLAEVGDQQSVLEGESTLMAKLNTFSSVIESVTRDDDSSEDNEAQANSSLILMDELGGGTDPVAGGAIAQAVLEKLLESENCSIVATTHSPRLKALSYNSTLYNCATVLLKSDPNGDFKRPSYKLEYGSIGDSYAIGAASRCSPPLPEDVLTRAASLMASVPSESDAEDVNYLRALTASLEADKEATLAAKKAWEERSSDLEACRKAMLNKAAAYSEHMDGVENRLQGMLREVRDDKSKDAIEVVGDTLQTLRLVKKRVKSEEELLRERGLKKVSPDHVFEAGESVVIITPGEHEGATGTVVVTDELDKNLVSVALTMPTWEDPLFSLDGVANGDASSSTRPLILKLSEVAVWDMNGIWDDFEEDESPTKSVRDSRQRLTGLLSTLSSSQSERKAINREPGSSHATNTFKSARERKAARGSKRKKK